MPRDTTFEMIRRNAKQLELKRTDHRGLESFYPVDDVVFKRITVDPQNMELRFEVNPGESMKYCWWQSFTKPIKSIVISDPDSCCKVMKALEDKGSKHLPEVIRLTEGTGPVTHQGSATCEPTVGYLGRRRLATRAATLGSPHEETANAGPPMPIIPLSAGLLLAVGGLLFARCLRGR